MLKHDVGSRIKYLRNKIGISQEKLALKSELDRTYLAGIESGKRNATLDSVEKIIKSLDISVKDLLQNGRYIHNYTFGLNWANEFMKTMMQQVYKKGNVVNTWGRKIVFVIQDAAMEYLKSAVDTSDLRSNMDDPVHFMTYNEFWDEELSAYKLKPAEWLSADLEGINKILAGANAKNYLTDKVF